MNFLKKKKKNQYNSSPQQKKGNICVQVTILDALRSAEFWITWLFSL